MARRRLLVSGLLVAAGWLLACELDRWAYHAIRIDGWNTGPGLRDWAQMLRAAGYLPVWLIAGVLIELAASQAPSRPRIAAAGWRLAAGAAMGGLLAELLKLIVRRHRPSLVNDGTHVYDWFTANVQGRGLGLASSHAGVAFGAAFILWRWSPRAGVMALSLACGCSMTRLTSGAHFLSDVFAAAVLAWLGSKLVWDLADRATDSAARS